MRELSIAIGIVDAVMEESPRRGVQVSAVHLRLGALSGVVKDALLFSYEVACPDTSLPGSQLIGLDVPAVIFGAVSAGASAAIGPTFLVSRLRHADDGRASRERT
jgi:Zn finger protein HypA/HybF involved in hydrogenase expression